jgi:hypothetical protein
MMKPVYLTPEFWATIVGNIVGLVVVFGGLTAEQGTGMTQSLQTIAGAVLSIVTLLGFVGGQSKRKIAAASLMMARIQAQGGDPLATIAVSLDGEARKLLTQL